ncbi:hypothetical protein [Mucilaginibacter lacusdianchii]|uniref:hypothetical protein n=1 Tax=Mucilaginibacter lacusdianchii TaxID=2684211 RepID=UPI00131C79A5|nr:hypothetical protein [Mucilaginibacter sp. JXJ CY 39]
MKHILPITIVALAATACSSPQNKNSTADSIVTNTKTKTDTITTERDIPSALVNGTEHFLHTEGTNHQDSTTVTLNLKGGTVTGQINWMPHEKDSRKGKLAGTRSGDMIDAVWTFMQEGMTDTLKLKFELKNNQLLQKPLKLNTQTGREQTDESADYTVAYTLMKKH